MEGKATIKEILKFVRFKICLSASLLSAIGYLAYAKPGTGLIYVALSSFMATASGYSYNNITDKAEDLINRKKINALATGAGGYAIVAACFLTGAAASLAITPRILPAYVSLTALGVMYSLIRIKRVPVLKNVYTASLVGAMYVYGAIAVAGALTTAMLQGYLFFAGYVFAGTLIADVRDIEGDTKAGIRTLASALGSKRARQMIYAIMLILSAYVIALGIVGLYAIMPLALMAAYFLSKGRYAASHTVYVCSFIMTALWSIIAEFLPGVST